MAFLLKHWRLIAGLAFIGLAFIAGMRYGAAGPKQELAEQRAEWSRLAAAGAAQALARQQELQEAADAAREALDDAKRQISEQTSRIAVLSVDAGRMRVDLARYAAARSGPDTVAACQDRAGTLAGLLAAGAGLVAEGTNLARTSSADHDRCTAEVRALLAGWPRNHGSDGNP
jgi:hypothetical protein